MPKQSLDFWLKEVDEQAVAYGEDQRTLPDDAEIQRKGPADGQGSQHIDKIQGDLAGAEADPQTLGYQSAEGLRGIIQKVRALDHDKAQADEYHPHEEKCKLLFIGAGRQGLKRWEGITEII